MEAYAEDAVEVELDKQQTADLEKTVKDCEMRVVEKHIQEGTKVKANEGRTKVTELTPSLTTIPLEQNRKRLW
ncbi:hypothetical protein NHX12_019093 [Muraenolepis orangiensis]|uniref:Uncharacterized protein n=1 Tax=Muraenolepis orangiensis TaxID=630683 RepID=A0A9Q0IWB2_9TELE|nr:hypothetical protein NHX12_019093 [Muraenolepis orangiensis]